MKKRFRRWLALAPWVIAAAPASVSAHDWFADHAPEYEADMVQARASIRYADTLQKLGCQSTINAAVRHQFDHIDAEVLGAYNRYYVPGRPAPVEAPVPPPSGNSAPVGPATPGATDSAPALPSPGGTAARPASVAASRATR